MHDARRTHSETPSCHAQGERESRKAKGADYWERRYSLAPLPALKPREESTFAASFLGVATVDSLVLDRADRLAALSADGRLQFQQRVIFYLTRFLPSVLELAEATNAVEAEISLQGSWVERAFLATDEEGQPIGIAAAERAFDEFMGEAGRREALKDILEQHRVNAEVHREIDDRYPTA